MSLDTLHLTTLEMHDATRFVDHVQTCKTCTVGRASNPGLRLCSVGSYLAHKVYRILAARPLAKDVPPAQDGALW